MPKYNLPWKDLEQLKNDIDYRVKLKKMPNSFDAFLRYVSPNHSWDWLHLVHIRKQLDRIMDGSLKRLMIFCPPRHGKTEMTTLHFPAYFLEKFPHKKAVIAAYNQLLANTFSRRVRMIAEERISLNKERTAVEQWETMEGGGLRAVGVGSGLTGQGGDLIVIDDPVKDRVEANSKTYRERVWEWYRDVLLTRTEPNAAIILIMTRWHFDDLAGRILASDDASDWEVIRLPALAEHEDPLGRKPGEALCPDRYKAADLLKLKSIMTSSFEALYQQTPLKSEGAILRVDALQTWSLAQIENPECILQSWDTAFKTGQENDFSVCTTWVYSNNEFFLIDRWKDKVAFYNLKVAAMHQAQKYKPSVILIEDHASGQSLLQELKRASPLPWLAVRADNDKVARANSIAPLIDVGKVFVPSGAPWLNDYMQTLSQFPYGEHDDDVDSTTQALNYLLQRFGFKSHKPNDIMSVLSTVNGWGT